MLSGLRVHPSIPKSEASALIDLTIKPAKRLRGEPPATVGLSLNSAAIHDVSCDSLFTSSELSASLQFRRSLICISRSTSENVIHGMRSLWKVPRDVISRSCEGVFTVAERCAVADTVDRGSSARDTSTELLGCLTVMLLNALETVVGQVCEKIRL